MGRIETVVLPVIRDSGHGNAHQDRRGRGGGDVDSRGDAQPRGRDRPWARVRHLPLGADLHGLAVTANEKTAYITARGVADEIKVLNLNGTDVSTILIDPRPGIADRPDSLARKGSNLYETVRFSGQVARIKTQTGSVDYIDVAPPATTGYAVHGIAVRP